VDKWARTLALVRPFAHDAADESSTAMARNTHTKRRAPEDQPDMFGGPPPQVYVPPLPIVRNTLKDMLDKMRAAKTWPWSESMVEININRHIPYLIGLLSDPAEAARWRAEIGAEAARLEAASAETEAA
jgi:hypothetical protein